MPVYVCKDCGSSFKGNKYRCADCGGMVSENGKDIIADFIKNNYKMFSLSSQIIPSNIAIICTACRDTITVKDIETLGVSINTYTMAIIRRTLDKHIAECDGNSTSVKKKIKAQVAEEQQQPGYRKIILED
jgi:DNA-directed RNA polymerase subunit RPC12/RpoP